MANLTTSERAALDRYLTQTPEEYFGLDVEQYSEEIWNGQIAVSEIDNDTLEKNIDTFYKWEDKLWGKDVKPELAARIIIRAYNIENRLAACRGGCCPG